MSTFIHQPNDKLFKQAMADVRVAKQFFEEHLPAKILQVVDFDSLTLKKHSFIDDVFKATEADVLYTVKLNGDLAYFYLLCENQSTVDATIAFRLWVYMVRIMEMHLKQNPKSPLPIVYPLVLYTGLPPWDAPKDIFSLFSEHAELAKDIFLQPYQLVDLQRMDDDGLRQHLWSGLVEFALKYREVRNFAHYLGTLFPWLRQIELHEGANFAKIVLTYVVNGVETDNQALFVQKANELLSSELRGEAMTLAQLFKQEGRTEGRAEKAREIAKQLLEEGALYELVAKVTGLSLDELNAL